MGRCAEVLNTLIIQITRTQQQIFRDNSLQSAQRFCELEYTVIEKRQRINDRSVQADRTATETQNDHAVQQL